MQKKSYRNGMKIGKAAKLILNFFGHIRHQMLARAGQSKWKKKLASMLFIVMVVFFICIVSSFLYFSVGIVGPVIILLIAIALPKIYPKSCDDKVYSFNDGYRDGPEGYGFYSGGYKVDD